MGLSPTGLKPCTLGGSWLVPRIADADAVNEGLPMKDRP